MSVASRAFAPSMLLAAGTFAGVAHGAVTVQTYNDFVATTTPQNVSIAGTDLYSFDLLGLSGAGTSAGLVPQFSSLGTARVGLGILAPATGALTTNDFYKTSFIGYPSTTGTSYANLSFELGGTTYYGAATFEGVPDAGTLGSARLTQIRYGTAADTQAEMSAAPEPATWAEMIGGLGAVGGAMRAARRRKAQTAATA